MRRSEAYRLARLLALGVFASGCPASRPMSVPPGESAILSSRTAGESQPLAVRPEVGGLRKDGSACFSSAHCLSNICEGASCDSSRPGTCVPSDRACTADVVEYCGCDGKTFLASSSCPGEAFESRSACPGEEPGVQDGNEEPEDAEAPGEALEDEESAP